MSSTSAAVSTGKRPQSTHIDGKPAKIDRVTGKVRVAVEAMVWLALPRAEAAKHAGISEHGLYKALRKPPVRSLYLAELEVLRTSERARNFHRLVEIRNQDSNQMASVTAIKALEQMGDNIAAGSGASQTPGVCIQIITQAPVQASVATDHAHGPTITTTYEESGVHEG